MSAAVLALFGVVMASAIAEMMIPDGDGGTRRFLHFLAAVAVLVLMLQPFAAFVSDADGALVGEVPWGGEDVQEQYEQTFSQAVDDRSAVLLERGLSQMLEVEYGIEAQECEVRVLLDDEGMPQTIYVLLSGKAILRDPDEIREALQVKFGCEVEVR